MQSTSTEPVSKAETAQEQIIWSLAFWVIANVEESKFGCGSREIEALAEEVLADNAENVHLQEALKGFGGYSGNHLVGMRSALTYVTRAYAKFSSVYPTRWLAKYREFVNHA